MDRIPLANEAFEGHNNAYLFDGKMTALIDPGDWRGSTRDRLAAALSSRDISFADIDEIILTHWHGDHAGLAGEIQAESGATVRAHTRDAPLVAHDEAALEHVNALRHDRYREWGMPTGERKAVFEMFNDEPSRHTPVVEPFEDGDLLALGDVTLEVVHTPGHTAGLSCFTFTGKRGIELLSGDTLLPVYTPNVGGSDVRLDRPLERYLNSLVNIAQANHATAWPGHRSPIDDPTSRAREILRHHEQRTWRILDVLRKNSPADAWTVSADLFGDLEGVHVIHGPGEAYAHLDHLAQDGCVESTDGKYQLTEETRERMDAVETAGRWPLVEVGDRH